MKPLLWTLTVVLALASTSISQTISLNPIADAFVSAENADLNFGSAGALAISATGSTNGIFYSVLKFDLTPAAGLSIQSITLQLTSASAVNNSLFNQPAAGLFSVIWMQDSSWNEGTGAPDGPTTDGITYDTLPSYLGPSDENLGTFSYSGDSGQADIYTLQLASGFLNAVTSGSTVSLELVPADSNVSYVPNSNNYKDSSAFPVLTVVTAPVPEPAGVPLLVIGLLVLAGCRRHWLGNA